jgi:hypothetical protein
MPLVFTKYLDALVSSQYIVRCAELSRNFQDADDSDFVIKCGSKTFYVHKIVLKCWPCFDRLLSSK